MERKKYRLRALERERGTDKEKDYQRTKYQSKRRVQKDRSGKERKRDTRGNPRRSEE